MLNMPRQYVTMKEEVNEWVDRYQQAMIDLHVAQLKLSQVAIGMLFNFILTHFIIQLCPQ